MSSSFIDNRGKLFSIKEIPFDVKEILVSTNHKNVLRGLHLSPYPKRVFVREGKIYDMWIHPETGDSKEMILEKGDYIDIPAGCAHGFYCYEESEIIYLLGGKFDASKDKTFFWNDPTLLLKRMFPKTDFIISEKDKAAPYMNSYEYYVLGARGFLGKHAVNALREQGHTVFESNERLQNIHEIEQQILKSGAKYVICAAGISGKPTIEWCESHEQETYDTNYIGMIDIMRLTKRLEKHLIIFGSGGVFTGKKESYSEVDFPDSTTMVYPKWRAELEKTLCFYPNILYLRIIYPCTLDGDSKCFLTKMLGRTANVHDIPVSLTIVPSLFPLIPHLCEKNITGILNFVNRGTLRLPEILEIYSDTIKEITFKINTEGNARGNYRLDTTKLESHVEVEDTKVAFVKYLKPRKC